MLTPSWSNSHGGLTTVVTNVSSNGDREYIQVYSAQLRNGNLFYAVAVAPANVFNSYRDTFDRVVRSTRLNQ